MRIIWKNIEGHNGEYQVSNTGMVKSVKRNFIKSNGRGHSVRERILRDRSDKRGYRIIDLRAEGVLLTYKVHRLVAIAFIPATEGKPHINHKDGNKSNNCIENLEWCNQSENMQHAWDMALIVPYKRAEQNPLGKIVLNTETGVFYYSLKEASDTHGIPISTLSMKLNHKIPNDTNLIYA